MVRARSRERTRARDRWALTGGSGIVAPVDVGVLSLGDWLTDPITGARQSQAERHRSIVAHAAEAETAGFTSFHIGEHHFSHYIVSSPPVVLAAIAERTSTIRLSNGVALAANLDPVRVAEDYATLDLLSGGRVEPCFGRGTFFPGVYANFGQDERHAKARFAESVELICRLWTETEVEWSGEHRAPLHRATVQPRPLQSPRPPIWLGAGTSADSIDLAARLGLWLMLPTVFGTPEMFAPMVARYEEKWEEFGHDPADRRIGCCSHAHLGVSTESARSEWEARYLHYFSSVLEWQRESASIAGVTFPDFPLHDFDTMCSTIALCGSVDHVIERMASFREMLHVDTHLLMFDLGGLPHDEVSAQLAMAGDSLLPALEP